MKVKLMEKFLSGAKKEKYIHDKSRKLLTKGNDLHSKNNLTKASVQYNKVIEYLQDHENDITTYKPYISGVYNDLGVALVKVKRENDALRIFDKALQFDPKNSQAWVNRGETLVTIEKYDDALKSFNTALSMEPDDKRALSFKGTALERLNKPKKAKEKTKGGLILPDATKKKPQEGVVVAVGPGRQAESGKRERMEVKVGDTIIYPPFGGQELKIDGEDLLIMQESNIWAKRIKK